MGAEDGVRRGEKEVLAQPLPLDEADELTVSDSERTVEPVALNVAPIAGEGVKSGEPEICGVTLKLPLALLE